MSPELIHNTLFNSGNGLLAIPGVINIFDTQSHRHLIDAQGEYYAEALETRIDKGQSLLLFPKDRRRASRKRLTENDIKLALSIVGIIEDGMEPDLSERFREYLYKND